MNQLDKEAEDIQTKYKQKNSFCEISGFKRDPPNILSSSPKMS